jgi:hypothetical protein
MSIFLNRIVVFKGTIEHREEKITLYCFKRIIPDVGKSNSTGGVHRTSFKGIS